MKKQGAYEMNTATPKQKPSKHLQMFITSLVSMILSISMLLSTTMAWFTDEVVSQGNQITVGELKVNLLVDNQPITDAPIFGAKNSANEDIIWKPNHVEVRTLTIENAGNLDILYTMNLIKEADSASIEEYFDVYVKAEGEAATVSYDGITSEDLTESKGWNKLGTLADLFQDGEFVYQNKNLEAYKNETLSIAVHMHSTVSNSDAQGKTLKLAIKLNAYQTDIPTDELNFDAFSDTLEGELTEPYTFPGGTLTIKNLNMAVAEGNAITITGNTNLIVEGDCSVTGGMDGSAILVAGGIRLEISGDNLTAIGNNGQEYMAGYTQYSTTTDESYKGKGGSGIGTGENSGTVIIRNLKGLTAKGYGVNGFGIGGEVAKVTISDTTITSARGGFVNQTGVVIDQDYTKSEPEGGAAIGGATIQMGNTHVIEAIGGSKAAGIGALYHFPTNIIIDNCTIDKVVGGPSAAGIGGSRIHGPKNTDATDQTVKIDINNSTISATGGYFGAGIGSGYDTYCHTPDIAPMHTINIRGNSVITAIGGKYAAGIGTGYHVAGLTGKIEDTVAVTATAGESREKYTEAMAVGFGVIDHSREAGTGNTSSFYYNEATITVATPTVLGGST